MSGRTVQPGDGGGRPAPVPPVDASRFVGRIDDGDALPHRVWRAVSTLVTSSRATVELERLVTATQIPLTTGRRIAVAAVRGGAGKSSIAAILASVFAGRRADPVLAADADPEGGSLPWRLGIQLGRGMNLANLAPWLLNASGGTLEDLRRLLPWTGTGLWLLPGGAPRQPELCRDVTRALSRLFAVCVTDCGRGLDSPAAVQVLSEAHAVVLAAPATPDGVRSACEMLSQYAGPEYSQLRARMVVALNTQSPAAGHSLRESEARKAIECFGMPVVRLPYDRHVAGGGPITPSAISEGTLVAATRLAGLALARAEPL
jgi:septum site-determining protein MinD